jgi:hypothetical protein
MARTNYGFNLHIPRCFVWPKSDIVVRNGVPEVVKYEGWRMALWMTRIQFHFRRLPLGSPNRHGLTIRLMTPWACVEWIIRNEEITTGALITRLAFHWGNYPRWRIKEGSIPWKHYWSKTLLHITLQERARIEFY